MRFAFLAILFLINSYNVFTQWERVKYPGKSPDSFANFNDLLLTSSFDNYISISKDNGLNWQKPKNGIWNQCVSRVHQYDRYMFAFAQGWCNNGIVFRSADKGESWISLAVNNLPEFINIRGVNSNSKYLYIGGSYCEGILRSSDFGSTWNSSNTGLPKHSRIYDIITFDSVVIIAVNIDSTDDYPPYYIKKEARLVYKSTNYGNSWKGLPTGFLGGDEKILAMYNDKKRNLFIGTKRCLYRSKDLGSTWSIINQDFGLTNCLNDKGETIRQTTSSISSITSFNNTLIALVSNGFYFSKNDGDNWEKMIINNKEVESRLNCYWAEQDGDYGIIHIKDSFLFFSSVYDSASLFRYNLFTNTALGIHSDIINEQNSFYIYPNPLQTDGSLQVQAYLPPSSRSYITVSDMLGKTLQTIELGSQDSYSEVKAPVSTEGLSNGVYMIQLHVNGNVISDKVIINR